MQASTKVDFTEFRRALGAFTTGVTVVTTRSESDGEIGLTANSFNSVSLDPPLVLWSLAKSARSLEAFKSCRYFAIHVLADEQEELSTRFAQRGADKFADLALERGPDEIPLLPDCAARFICTTRYQYEGGDHIIFVGEVIDFSHWPRSPLLFHSGKYGQIQRREAAGTAEVPDDSLGYLLRFGYRCLIEPLLIELGRRELTIGQHHFLAHLARTGHVARDKLLASLTAAGTVPTEAEIDGLVARKLIDESTGEVQLTEAGFALRIELAAVYKSIESDALQSIGYASAQTLKLHLGLLINALAGSPSPSTDHLISESNATGSRENLR